MNAWQVFCAIVRSSVATYAECQEIRRLVAEPRVSAVIIRRCTRVADRSGASTLVILSATRRLITAGHEPYRALRMVASEWGIHD